MTERNNSNITFIRQTLDKGDFEQELFNSSSKKQMDVRF